MELLFVVLAFLVPVVMVFAYSVWLHRRRRSSGVVDIVDRRESEALSVLVKKCTDLKTTVSTDNAGDIEEDIDSILVTARSLRDQNLRELALGQVMGVYIAMGREEEARKLLSEVKEETNRAEFLKTMFGNGI